MSKISYGLNLGRSFDSISLKFDRLVGSMKNWSCIVFEPNRSKKGEGVMGHHVNSRIFGI